MKLLLIVALAIIVYGEDETVGQPGLFGSKFTNQQVRGACRRRNAAMESGVLECLRGVPEIVLREAANCATQKDIPLNSAEEINHVMNVICGSNTPGRALTEAVDCTKDVIKKKEAIRAVIIFNYETMRNARTCLESYFYFPIGSDEMIDVNE